MKSKPYRGRDYYSFLEISLVQPVGAYCIRPNMYPAFFMSNILYQQKFFITR